jgi:serine/threonine-protein kinase
MIQTRLASALDGRYAIEREVGRGGMATVYLARDVRHHRRVALKVLNPELGAVLGTERFLAEIEVTANLQHPNLLPLFDSGEADGLLFYVMPFVDGESLRARLDREKQLPVDEALRIAASIAGALDYAHRCKVIHRDLKPENILMQEGQPLIADFGIALAVSNAGGARITQTGLSLGTPQYMSPEQATGDRAVDGRTDIYSLGAILYEMLIGDPPHAASTSQAIIAKVLTERPASLRTSRPTVPPHVDAAVARALEKLPADRFSTAREFADAIDARSAVVSAATYVPPVVPTSEASRPRHLRELAAWALVAALGIGLGWRQLRPHATADAPVVRVNFDLPPNVRINDVIVGTTIAVSPKGEMIAFTSVGVNGFRMYIRRVNEIVAREIGDSNLAGRNLAFSPDGRWLAFTEGNVLKKIAVDGGQPVTVGVNGGTTPYGVVWSPTDTIYIGGFSGLWKVPASGGLPQLVSESDSGAARVGRRWPYLMPDGRAILFASGSSSATSQKLGVVDVASGKATEYEIPIAMPLGMIDDQLVYVTPAGGLMAVRFDRASRRPTGQPVQMDEGILVDPTAGVKASLSASGTLAYLKGRAQYQPVVAHTGSSTTDPLIKEPAAYSTPRYSPDGQRVAVAVFGSTGSDIWVYDIPRNTFTRLTSNGNSIRPEWTPDGRSVVYVSGVGAKASIQRQPADGSGPAELLYQPEQEAYEAFVSPDNQWVIYRTAPGAKYPRDILAVRLAGDRAVTPLVTGPNTESLPRLSPDGKWLAYQSNESGRFEIYVRPFPASGARVQVSDVGGTEAIWGPDGRSLYYRGALGEVVHVAVTTGASFSIGARKTVLTGDYLTDSSHPNWDVGRDGRFLMLKRAGAESQTVVVHNWARELREKTAPRQ